ncbi:MAG: hypothetical protein QGH15_11870 [Kiritimatiellia bacterium]|jgi:REP element-mobilizing transposase RayT|nr:hypothetical protein [Kiritimatiellia bacterium]
MDRPETLSFRRRNLPHWVVADGTYFVTFRLKGTLPLGVVREYEERLNALLEAGADRETLASEQRRHFCRIEAILDDPHHKVQDLRDDRIAELVMGGFEWLSKDRQWRIYAAVVMPNHVHCCLRNFGGRSEKLASDIGSVKKYVARRANQILGREGQFWQNENFDHWCRSEDKVEGCVRYVLTNPVKAGFVDDVREWSWIRIDQETYPDILDES